MINIQIDTKQIERMIGVVDPKQIKFAAAVALSRTANEVRDAVKADMPNRFTLRREWVQKGIRSSPASPNNLTATVYSKDPFMARQETGGLKFGTPSGGNFSSESLPQTKGRRPRQALGRVAIPTDKVLRTKQEIIRKSDLPKGLGVKGFVIGKPGRTQFLARRFAKGKRAGLQLLYILKDSTRLKPRLGLREIGERTVQSKFGEIFSNALAQAIATARKP